MSRFALGSILILVSLNGCGNKNLVYAEKAISHANQSLMASQSGIEASQAVSTNRDSQLWIKSSTILMESTCANINWAEDYLNKVSKQALSKSDLVKYDKIEKDIKNTREKVKIDCSKVPVEKL